MPTTATELADGAAPPANRFLPSRSRAGSLHRLGRKGTAALYATAAAMCGLAVALVALGAPAGERLGRSVLELLIVAPPVAVGLFAARSPHNARFGALLAGSGLIWSLTALGQSTESLPYSIGRVSAWLIFPLLLYLILAFPAGRPAPGLDRRLFGSATLLIGVLFIGSALFVEQYPLQTPWASCSTDCPPNAFLVLHSEPAVMESVVEPVRELLAILVLLGVCGSVVMRMRRATPLRRRTNGPVLAMSLLSTAILIAYLVTRRADPGAPAVDVLNVLWGLCIPGIAIAFLIGLLRRRLFMGEVLQRLSLALGPRMEARPLQDILATALGDPTLEVVVGDDEVRLVHDPALFEDEEILQAVRSFALATLRVERLEGRLASSLSQLERSRARIAKAADLERSRIERDLHDGAQQRLIMLRIRLSIVEELLQSDPSAGPEALRGVGDEIDVTLDELRSLAHGVYPSVLRDRGLRDALRSVALQSPVPIQVEAAGLQRHPPEVEAAVYFVCVEAIQNAVKHARGATRVWITLRDDGSLSFEVRDDGSGFGVPVGERAGGLRNMRDRLEAVGGRLTIDSAPGRGTRIRGRIPSG